jgi:CheY-like chemotaxis protein
MIKDKNGKLVLLVEDNPIDEVLALKALESGGIINQTMVVRDGQEALDYLFCKGDFLGRTSENPQVVLLDLHLPLVSGLDVLKKIRTNESTKLLPVVVLTSSQDEADKITAFGNGVNRYLSKPINMEKFAEAMNHFITHYASLVKNEE